MFRIQGMEQRGVYVFHHKATFMDFTHRFTYIEDMKSVLYTSRGHAKTEYDNIGNPFFPSPTPDSQSSKY